MTRLLYLMPVLILINSLTVFAQSDTALNNVTNKTISFLKNHPIEKAYLQFDKPYYAAGDTVYFKAYITLGDRHEPSALSWVLHVDLINANNKIDQSIKLQIDSGVAWGDFALPDSLPKGNYRIRAYTQWMRNDDERDFFDKAIYIGSILKNTPPANSTPNAPLANAKPDIQFFPESGVLVNGILSKMAFKAIGANGLGIGVKGIVTDNENKEVCTFEATHLGMGYCYIKPAEGKTYKANVIYADGTQDTIKLPVPKASGIVLSVDNDSIPKAVIKIEANAPYYDVNRRNNYLLLIYSGGKVITVACKLDSPAIRIDVLKRRLPTGIARLTLFSADGQPLCERLLFVQSYEQLGINVSSDKAKYAKRGKVLLHLNVRNRADSATSGHFSVAVIDEGKVPVDENNENTILSNLLLTSDVNGYVEQPNYYFNYTNTEALKHLDVLMLTQGYRRFTWKQVLGSNQPIAYQAEKGLEISGSVHNLFGKAIANGQVTLLPAAGGAVVSTATNDKGLFHFSNLIFTDTTHFVLSAVNKRGKNATKLTYFAEAVEPTTSLQPWLPGGAKVADATMSTYLENTKNYRNESINYGLGKGITLREVKIRDKKRDDHYNTQSLAGAGHADQVIHSDEMGHGFLSDALNGRLRGITFASADGINMKMPVLTVNLMMGIGMNTPHPMALIVDGANMDPELFDFINAENVETVEVLKYASTSIYGVNGGNGVIIVTTKQGGGSLSKDIVSSGILPIRVAGFYRAREFYSPKYKADGAAIKGHDLRSTIYWQPEIRTDKDGNASIDFYNADGAGTYRVVVEGIDDKGNLGRQVFKYMVE